MKDKEYQCPICHAKLNSNGEPFFDVRAVSLHIAGKIRGGDSNHKIWAYENYNRKEVDEAVEKARSTSNINYIGDLLTVSVKRWHDENSKPNLGFKK